MNEIRARLSEDGPRRATEALVVDMISELHALQTKLGELESTSTRLESESKDWRIKATWAGDERMALESILSKCESKIRKLQKRVSDPTVSVHATPPEVASTPVEESTDPSDLRYERILSKKRQQVADLETMIKDRDSTNRSPDLPPLVARMSEKVHDMGIRPGAVLSFQQIRELSEWLETLVNDSKRVE
jgi:hypothetical protein